MMRVLMNTNIVEGSFNPLKQPISISNGTKNDFIIYTLS